MIVCQRATCVLSLLYLKELIWAASIVCGSGGGVPIHKTNEKPAPTQPQRTRADATTDADVDMHDPRPFPLPSSPLLVVIFPPGIRCQENSRAQEVAAVNIGRLQARSHLWPNCLPGPCDTCSSVMFCKPIGPNEIHSKKGIRRQRRR